MIDERHEELAALYALGLLEGKERAQFEAALARDLDLQALVRELRETSVSLARTAAVTPPPALKARVLASIDAATAGDHVPGNIVRPSFFSLGRFAPWAIAASFALMAVLLGQRYFLADTEASVLRRQQTLTDLVLQSMRQQLEAERLVNGRRAQDLDRQLTQARNEAERTAGQLADANTRIAGLTQQVDTLAGATADLTRQLEQTRTRIAQLTADIVVERDLAEYKISVLASLVKDNPQAIAVALWDPGRKQGVLKVEKLPALATNQDYQLWVIDPQYKDPVDGGVFTVDPRTGVAQVKFTAKQPVNAVNAFAVSLERKGGVPKAEGPIVLLGK